jgi:methylene-tetrahydromethanopterin dehydrogenase
MPIRSVLHLFDPSPHTSPFDINMAVDADFDVIVPHSNVNPDEIYRLVRDVIFSRGPKGVKKTAIFLGGRDLGLALDMLDTCRSAMVDPFQVSVLADPSGAFTTAAALVACVEDQLKEKHESKLDGLRAVVFGGTGPVGIATGVLASLNGAETTIVDHLSIETAMATADKYNGRCGARMRGTFAASEAEKARLIAHADVIFCTAKAGIQVLDDSVLEDAQQLKVAGDVNAVPPLGIEGLRRKHYGAPLDHARNSPGAVGIGALAIGDVKYKLQQRQLKMLLDEPGPLFLEFRKGFEQAREILANR